MMGEWVWPVFTMFSVAMGLAAWMLWMNWRWERALLGEGKRKGRR